MTPNHLFINIGLTFGERNERAWKVRQSFRGSEYSARPHNYFIFSRGTVRISQIWRKRPRQYYTWYTAKWTVSISNRNLKLNIEPDWIIIIIIVALNFRLSCIVKICLSFSIYIGYALSNYVAFEIIWGEFEKRIVDNDAPKIYWEYTIRIGIVFGTCKYIVNERWKLESFF